MQWIEQVFGFAPDGGNGTVECAIMFLAIGVMAGGAAVGGTTVLLRRADIPMLDARLIVNELLWMLSEETRKEYRLKPRHWAVLMLVWHNTLRQRYTTSVAAAQHTGFSHQAAGMWLADLEDMGYAARDAHGWCATKEAMRNPTLARSGGRRPLLLFQIEQIHAASDRLRALEKRHRK